VEYFEEYINITCEVEEYFGYVGNFLTMKSKSEEKLKKGAPLTKLKAVAKM
jgi:hypothetical protein